MSLKHFIQNKLMNIRCNHREKMDAKYMPKYSVFFEGKTREQIHEFWHNLYCKPYDLKEKIQWGRASRYEIFEYIMYSEFIADMLRHNYRRTSKKFYKYFTDAHACLRQSLEEMKYSKNKINNGLPYFM